MRKVLVVSAVAVLFLCGGFLMGEDGGHIPRAFERMTEAEMSAVTAGCMDCVTGADCKVLSNNDESVCVTVYDPYGQPMCSAESLGLICETYQPDPPDYGEPNVRCETGGTDGGCEEHTTFCAEVSAKQCIESPGTGNCVCSSNAQTGAKTGTRWWCEET